MHINVILCCMGTNDKFIKGTFPQEFSVHSMLYLRTRNLGIQRTNCTFFSFFFIEQKTAHRLNADGKSGSWSSCRLPNSKWLKSSCQKKLLMPKLGPSCRFHGYWCLGQVNCWTRSHLGISLASSVQYSLSWPLKELWVKVAYLRIACKWITLAF